MYVSSNRIRIQVSWNWLSKEYKKAHNLVEKEDYKMDDQKLFSNKFKYFYKRYYEEIGLKGIIKYFYMFSRSHILYYI